MNRRTGSDFSFGRLRLIDYIIVIYCALRILRESQARDLDEKGLIFHIVWELPLFLVIYFLSRTESSTTFVTALQYLLVRKLVTYNLQTCMLLMVSEPTNY